MKEEKAAGHAILDQMIQAHPKFGNLGLQDKAMINLQQAIGRRIKTWSHRDLISVRMLVEYGTGLFAGSVYGHPWLGPIIGLGAAVIEHPVVKSALSIALGLGLIRLGKR